MNKELWTILPETLQETFADTTARMVTESLCLFYVALTRARHSLLLLTQPITAQKIPSTFAGLLLATLTDQSQAGESQLLYEAGDPDWFLHLPQMSAAPAIPAAPQTTTQLPAIRLAKPLPCRERGLPRRTPSQHDRAARAGGDGEPTNSVAVAVAGAITGSGDAAAPRTDRGRRPNAASKAAAQPIDPRLRGIVFHAGFEALKWLADGETPNADTLYTRLRRQVQDQSLTADLLRRLVDEFLQSLSLPAVRHVFSRDALGGSTLLAGWCEAVRAGRADVVVDCERSFVRIHDGALIQGTIDRLVLVRENGRVVAADVVDFKTDRLNGDAQLWRREKAEHYAGQLQEYRSAVRHITSAPQLPVSTRLLLLEDASVIEVPGP